MISANFSYPGLVRDFPGIFFFGVGKSKLRTVYNVLVKGSDFGVSGIDPVYLDLARTFSEKER